MEGGRREIRRLLVLAVVLCAALTVGGCGGDGKAGEPSDAAVDGGDALHAFAPLVLVPADERYRPMSARWFLERSIFGFAEDEGCPNRRIAVGRTMPELQNPTIDWIFPQGLGRGPAYYRNPHDANCDLTFGVRAYANQLTRPHDPGVRADGLAPGEGFYLDLADDARGGPPLPAGDSPLDVPAYGERTDEGDGGVRLTYWLLFGMHAPEGRPDEAREGDWERVDVILRDEGGDRLAPVALQLGAGDDGDALVELPWEEAALVEGSHPVVAIERGSHAPRPAAEVSCVDCARWPTWRSLADARAQLWYGFGGAWGEVGDDDATTGPLGPHGHWPTPDGARGPS